VMQRTPGLPPLRGGIKGGVHPASAMRDVDHLHRRLSPPSVPPRWGGRPGRALHGGCGRGGGVDGGLRYSGRMTPATDSPPPQPGPAAQDALGRGVYDAVEAVRLLNFQRDATPVRRVQEFH